MKLSMTAKGTLAAAALFCLSVAAQAATVTFSNISATDGNDSAGFSVAGTSAAGNDLMIDVTPFSISGFQVMIDTFEVTVTAPTGYWITGLAFKESGEYNATDGAIAASVQMLANGTGPMPGSQFFSASSGGWGPLGQAIDLTGQQLTSVQVSIMNSLFAANASVNKTSAILTATVAPIPLPAAVWMLGTSLASLLVVTGRNRRA